MNLRKIIRDDLEDVFFDMEEFAERHTVNGKEMCIIFDENELLERKKEGRAGSHFDGAYLATAMLYVKAEEYGPRPKAGSVLVLDEKKVYRITAAVDEGGVYSIALEANKI